ncbi:hypothetical protein DL546_002682 [Coniochaeta pulveracea]|uniref:Uncharacterized protein n=1 Tax=Coniochaeta pulveracea TaxID=177199 RepID=A0A420Y6L5_9PEZI|nr:hypothetical protein DL546_002682 [Coniochaeta pulveracea]
MVEVEGPDADSVASSDTNYSSDSEDDNVLVAPDVHVPLTEDTFAQLEAAILEPRPETEPLPILRVLDTPENIEEAPKIRTMITRRITEFLHKAKSKVKLTGKGECRTCGPYCRGSIHKGLLWCKRCGQELSVAHR